MVAGIGVVVLLVSGIALTNRDQSESRPAITSQDGKPTTPVSGSPTRDGARDAATRYAERLGGEEMFRTQPRHALLTEISDPARRDAILTRYDTAYTPDLNRRLGLSGSGRPPAGQDFISETLPTRAVVTDYQPRRRATVKVRCTGLIGFKGTDVGKPLQSSHFTMTVTLTWSGNRWTFYASDQS
jgi:hypothetical protein